MEVINRNLRVSVELEENVNALYCEEGLNGFTTVTRNDSGEEGEIDLEILFNTIVASGSKVKKLINGEV